MRLLVTSAAVLAIGGAAVVVGQPPTDPLSLSGELGPHQWSVVHEIPAGESVRIEGEASQWVSIAVLEGGEGPGDATYAEYAVGSWDFQYSAEREDALVVIDNSVGDQGVQFELRISR